MRSVRRPPQEGVDVPVGVPPGADVEELRTGGGGVGEEPRFADFADVRGQGEVQVAEALEVDPILLDPSPFGDGEQQQVELFQGVGQPGQEPAGLPAGLRGDGAVCSAVEAPALRHALGAGFKLVTPGIRPAGSPADDQSRIVTPEAAIAGGADYLVIGRPITQAADPLEALARINRSLEVAA